MSQIEISTTKIIKFKNSEFTELSDSLAIEEPLEISLSYWKEEQLINKNISITMRTPGADTELALGFLVTEGIIKLADDIERVSEILENKVTIKLKKGVEFDLSKIERHFYTSSSCGVCGKSSIDSIRTIHRKSDSFDKLNDSSIMKISKEIILNLNKQVTSQQAVFESTGGLHASSLFNLKGEFLELYEDVGRHNALDKLIGSKFLKNEFPLKENILLLSGRASFELIQKAAMADISVICALGAPSSLAVSLAKEFDITLIGFLKENSFNIYNGAENIV
ncbi:MAG: formate dehydrogenase accessory sulfurtransferase FdhD [Bacteroidota bacterium]